MRLQILHWIFVFIGLIFIIYAIVGVIIKKAKFLFQHKLFSTFGIIFINLSIISIYFMNKKFNVLYSHGFLGFLFLLISILTLILGFVYVSKTKSKNKRFIRTVHIWIGRLLFIILILNIYFGIVIFKPFK